MALNHSSSELEPAPGHPDVSTLALHGNPRIDEVPAHSSSRPSMLRLAARLFLWAAPAALFAVTMPVQAQRAAGSPGPQPPSQAEIKASAAAFISEVEKSCIKAGTFPGVKNVSSYCACFSQSFAKRYSPEELAAIRTFPREFGLTGIRLINTLSGPESRACLAANR